MYGLGFNKMPTTARQAFGGSVYKAPSLLLGFIVGNPQGDRAVAGIGIIGIEVSTRLSRLNYFWVHGDSFPFPGTQCQRKVIKTLGWSENLIPCQAKQVMAGRAICSPFVVLLRKPRKVRI